MSLPAYRTRGSKTTAIVTAGDGNESTDLDTAISGRTQETLGNQTIAVDCTMSIASATAEIVVIHRDAAGSVTAYQRATATAEADDLSDSRYVAPTLFFDTLGWPKYEVRHKDPSAGNVSIWAYTYGGQLA